MEGPAAGRGSGSGRRSSLRRDRASAEGRLKRTAGVALGLRNAERLGDRRRHVENRHAAPEVASAHGATGQDDGDGRVFQVGAVMVLRFRTAEAPTWDSELDRLDASYRELCTESVAWRANTPRGVQQRR